MKYIYITFVYLLSFFSQQINASGPVILGIDEWLDPSLKSRKIEVMALVQSQEIKKIPSTDDEVWGNSLPKNTHPALMMLMATNQFYQTQRKRVEVADLGTGFGYSAVLQLLAGARVHAVERNLEAITEANKVLFKTAKEFFSITKETAGEYYRAYREDLLCKEPNWMKNNYKIAISENVIHFMNPEECHLFADRLHHCVEDEGIVHISVESPFYDKKLSKYYDQERNKGNPFPGYAVYSRTKMDNKITSLGMPVIPSEDFSLKPSRKYQGYYTDKNEVKEIPNAYHFVMNYFKKEELAKFFEGKGFKVGQAFYTNDRGGAVQDNEIEIGKLYTSHVLLIKKKRV